MPVLTLAMSEAERDSVGIICGGAGADASSDVCSELRAATSAYLHLVKHGYRDHCLGRAGLSTMPLGCVLR